MRHTFYCSAGSSDRPSARSLQLVGILRTECNSIESTSIVQKHLKKGEYIGPSDIPRPSRHITNPMNPGETAISNIVERSLVHMRILSISISVVKGLWGQTILSIGFGLKTILGVQGLRLASVLAGYTGIETCKGDIAVCSHGLTWMD